MMKKSALFLILAAIVLTNFSPSAAPNRQTSSNDDPAAVAKKLVNQLAKGDFTGATESFDETMKTRLPAEKLTQAWNSLITKVGGYKRQLGERTERMLQYEVVFVTCRFEKTVLDVKVVFNDAKQITGLWFVPTKAPVRYKPPNYVRRDLFREQQTAVGSGDWALPGTLTLPAGKGPFAAVVLVHGSGPHDRDETLGPNKPFRDLAWGLACRGIAVLRYEKRTKAHAAKTAAIITKLTVKEETIDDALAAVHTLRNTNKIDTKRIFVLGHSLGGMLAPRIGRRDPHVAGLIVMGGPTRPLEDVILEQITDMASADGKISAAEQEQLDKLKRQVASVKDPKLSQATPASDLPLSLPARYWLDLRSYDLKKTVDALAQPMLILQGGRDSAATMVDFQGWKKILSGRENAEFKIYPKLNHLFITGEGKSTPAEYRKPGHVAEAVILDIARWIKTPRDK